MKTALKRSVHRAADPTLRTGPPVALRLEAEPCAAPPAEVVAFYRCPATARRGRLARLGRALLVLVALAAALIVGVAAGTFLWFDRAVAAVQARSPAIKRAETHLALPLPGRPAIALLLGVDTRAGNGGGSDNTDTMMLVRADPRAHTISLLSFPRDLNVPIYCGGAIVAQDRINAALARCGPTGVLETVAHLTALPINYLISVDFHGFKEIVDRLGGIWIDVDRTYYNKNVGTAATDYSNIDLQPGYQRLSGGEALAYVRYRHTDSDLYRLAREQEFVRAVKEQISANFDPLTLPSLVSAITSNVQVGSKTPLGDSSVLSWALFGATLPAGHVVSVSIPTADLTSLNVGGADELSASPAALHQAVTQFLHPAVVARRTAKPAVAARPAAPAAPRPAAPPARATTLTVLNGNGVPGAAGSAASLLGARGYHLLAPPGGVAANAPTMDYAETEIYFDPGHARAGAAAASLAKLIGPAAVRALPSDPAIRALDPGAMLLVVLGRSFSGALAPARPPLPVRTATAVAVPSAAAIAQVESAGSAVTTLLAPLARQVPFALETPTVLAAGSLPDAYGGDQPVRLYAVSGSQKALRLVFVTGGNQFWGIEETGWSGAPVLRDRNLTRVLKGRTYSLYYANGHLHMVVLQAGGATYWVVNTLLNSLSNPTMIAIAEALTPLRGVRG